ncbi:MAG: SusD/RagB family nutrient-binding outer membrane lipoprotein [Crocinitomicaceae bacterium]
MKAIGILLAVILVLISCRKDFDEINSNPNEPTIANVDYLFTQSLIKGGGQFSTSTHSNVWTMMVWTQQMADVNGVLNASNPYAYSDDWNDELWKEWYADVLSPVNEVIRLTEDDPYLINKHSIARIWRVFTMQRITDLWGDVPYSEALQGFNSTGDPILQPAYDPQEDIYADLLNELKEATASLDAAQGNFLGADIVYNGDLDSWAKFANSLRLRVAMRMVSANPTLAAQHIEELLLENNFISSNQENASIIYNAEIRNPFYELDNSGQGMRNPSQFFIDQMISSDDPRISVYCEETPSSIALGTAPYSGVPNLLSSSELNAMNVNAFTSSAVGTYFLQEWTPVVLMGYPEVQFLISEAQFRGFSGSGSMQSNYELGVQAAFEEVGLPTDSATIFLANGGTFDGTLKQVITQKWITLAYKDGYEAFAELRRTGFPELTDHTGSLIDMTTLPKRLEYPISELTLNGTNVSSVGEGINDFFTPVWWNQ